MNDSMFGDGEGLAWPSYVDFLFAFCFVLVLSLGYMTFLAVHGVEGQDFAQEANGSKAAFASLKIDPKVYWDRKTIEVPLNSYISFATGCPGKNGCQELTGQEQEKLWEVARILSTDFSAAHTIFLRGQTDSDRGSDDFRNFRIANERALAVYSVFYGGANELRMDGPGGVLSKMQLANAGATLAEKKFANKLDRTVTIVLDYSEP